MINFKRVLLGAFFLSVSVIVIGTIYQKIGERNDAIDFPPPGEMVDVGGHRLHVLVSGEGSPTVVIDSGLGESMIDWGLVVPEVASVTRIVTYDRAGLGWSDSGPEPRTSGQIVEELHRLLDELDIEGPLVLVGHSFGGVNMRLFRHRYPAKVRGLVLVESSHEDMIERFPPEVGGLIEQVGGMMAVSGWMARVGGVRLVAALLGPEVVMPLPRPLPDDMKNQYLRFFCTPKMLDAIGAEARSVPESFAQIRAYGGDLGALPLVVITGAESTRRMGYPDGFPLDEIDRTWNELQRDLKTRSSNSRQIIVQDSSHDVMLDAPEAVIQAIAYVVNEVRNGFPASVTESE